MRLPKIDRIAIRGFMTESPPVFDKQTLLDQAQRFREKGERAIRTAGIEVDEILAKEIISPNSDTRNGVSIIARPLPEVAEEIRRIQRHLFALEPQQYYYPPQDLHTTIVEVAFGKTPAEVSSIVEQLHQALPAIMRDLPEPILEIVGMGFDPKGCAINFVPRNEQLQILRAQIQERLEGIGIPLKSRYLTTAAHVSFFRYIQPLQTEKNQWADYLIHTPIDMRITWKISSLCITWGPNWYGNWSRIHTTGPFPLEPG